MTVSIYETLQEEKRRYVGHPVKRKEDHRFLTGRADFITGIKIPNMLRVGFVRSTYSHAIIKKISTVKAEAVPGISAIFSGKNLAHNLGEVPCAVDLPFANYPKYKPMADQEVNFSGEIVAVVIGDNEYSVRDACELVEVEYDDISSVIDPEEAMREGSTIKVHSELPTNLAYRLHQSFGAVEELFEEAERKLSYRICSQRVFPLPIETRAVAASYDEGSDMLTIWSATQYPHLVKTFVSQALGHPEDRMRVIAPEIGGGFGLKSNLYGEEIIIPTLAKVCRRPVLWVETRSESMLASAHARDAIQYVDVAVTSSGIIKAMKVKLICDIGAYFHFLTPGFPISIGLSIPNYYKISAYEVEINAVFTNKKSTDAYRGVIACEANFCMERIMDLVASELGLDPAEIRMRNYIKPNEYPFTTITGSVNPAGDHPQSLRKLLEMIDYERFRSYQKEQWSQGRYFGVGFSSFWELSGFGPPSLGQAFGLRHGTYESAWIRVLPTGKVSVTVGSSPQGQGHETLFSQIVADSLQINFEDVTVFHGDTLNAPYGIGTWASRSAAVGGAAVSVACERVKQKARLVAAALLGCKPSSAVFEKGSFYDQDSRKRISFENVVEEAYMGRRLPGNLEPGLEATCYYNPKESTFASGTHAATVEVDVECGSVKLLRYLAANDFGNLVNPAIVDGQVHGGVMQGIGQALLEKIEYDENGQLLNPNLLDYLIPTSLYPEGFKSASIETEYYSTRTTANPLGVKGMGESGAIAAPAAIVNAIEDALRPFGARIFEMPVSPEMITRMTKEKSLNRLLEAKS